MMTNDPSVLLNWNTPFDQQKIQLLDTVVAAMYSGNNQNVSGC